STGAPVAGQSGITMNKLMSILSTQNFKDEKEALNFVNGLMSGNINPSFEMDKETENRFKAVDMIAEAYGLPPAKGKKLVAEALKLDPLNADAYCYLGDIETDLDKAIKQYRKAVEVGRQALGEEAFQEY